MNEAFICDYIRTPIGRFGGALSSVRTDDLAATPLKALVERNPALDCEAIEDVIFGCANQAGKITAMLPVWRHCLPVFPLPPPVRRSTGFAVPGWMPCSSPHAPFVRVKQSS